MPSHSDHTILPYSPSQLFALVADIEKYPEFIPWCRAARITGQSGNQLTAELVVSFKHITESYVSRVTLSPPENEKSAAGIDVEMVSGPFEHLTNQWKVAPSDEGTRVEFAIDFKFRSKLLDMLVGGLFMKANSKLTEAFRKRADALYSVEAG